MRYDLLIQLAAQKKPDVLVEIGTHRGKRASQFKHHCGMYYGFDLWDAGNDETDKRESNGKGRSTLIEARAALQGAEHELIPGDTRNTLPEFLKRGVKADFVFIDGGHSIETIESDWTCVLQMLAPGAIVVFDDYYEPVRAGFGCNSIVNDFRHILLQGDVIGDTMIRLVKYVHEG